jgi:hypothetical protein
MESSKLDPAELWDEHVRKLQAIESEMQQTEAFLESVMEKRASPRIRSLLLASYVPRKGEQQEYIISAKGEVLYSQELKDGLFGTGISFTSINEEARRLLRS